jgi:uncharacterized lipoprotein YddW (UPF0748 family)
LTLSITKKEVNELSILFRSIKMPISLFTALILLFGTLAASFGSVLPIAYADSSAVALIDGFETVTNMSPAFAKANSVKLDLLSRPDPVLYGYHAAKLTYDFIGQTGTSAAYINFKDPAGSAGRTLLGKPKKLGVWVYGDAGNHWLRAQLQDAAGTKTTVDITSSNGLNWSGWKYVTVTVPSTLPAPLKLTQLYVVETKDNNKNAGVLYFDQLTAFYTDSTIYGLDVLGLPPLQAGGTGKASVFATSQGATDPTEVKSGITFSSSNLQVATIDSTGSVQALQAGTTTITADYSGGPQGSYLLTVSEGRPIPQTLELTAQAKLETSNESRIKVYATYSGMSEPVTVLSGSTFKSSNSETAVVDVNGIVKAIKAGTSTITVTYGGVAKSYDLTVTNPVPVLQNIMLTGLKSLTIGESAPAKVWGTYTWLSEPVDRTNDATFTSSNPAVASVSPGGSVTALKVGATRITAVYGGKTSDYYLTVNKLQEAPKRELRAAWIATVDNVDWPEKGVITAEEQKRTFVAMLDQLEASGINAVIVQVKPTADSFYPSEYGPWSEWLTGVQGKDPGYNPLAFMLEEVHKRNMEFHAWFNPYRISLQDKIDKLVPTHPARLHPDWVVSYGGKLYYNPGVPEAKTFIQDSIMEVVKNYDIDAVHFDDYFYPYPVSGVDFPDDAAFQAYGSGFANKADWRRNNVNTFVQTMNAAIKQEKSYVKFGISPFGIWRNKGEDPTGSDTNGLSSYSAIFADTKKWVGQEWIDYITPQIYWYLGYSPAAYDKLVEWWSGVVQGKRVQLYSGQAVYRIGSSDPAWQNPEEMPNQIKYNRNFEAIKGSMFFSAKWLPANPLGFTGRLKSDFYRYPALVPTMPWLDNVAPAVPVVKSVIRRASGVEISWLSDISQSDAAYYVIYRYDGGALGNPEDPSHILGTVRKGNGAVLTFVDKTALDGATYTYAVTAVDRLHNESAFGNSVTITNVLDVTAPVTTASVVGTDRNGWYVSDVTITLSATDDLTGVQASEISLDGGANWQPYTTSVTVTADGVHSIQYRSTDIVGNVETARTLRVAIDRAAPTVVITGAGVYTIDQTVTINCTATDTVSGVVYNPCESPLVQAPAYELGLGIHDMTAEATDAAGNMGTETATYTVVSSYDSLAVLTDHFIAGPGKEGITNSLLKKLEHKQLDAYIKEVSAQNGKRLTVEQANALIRFAEALK